MPTLTMIIPYRATRMMRLRVIVIIRTTRISKKNLVHGLTRENTEVCRSAYEVIRSISGMCSDSEAVLIHPPDGSVTG